MARKPNYDFERRERERLKTIKKAEREVAKTKPATDDGAPAADAPDGDAKSEQ